MMMMMIGDGDGDDSDENGLMPIGKRSIFEEHWSRTSSTQIRPIIVGVKAVVVVAHTRFPVACHIVD
uniref:Uncharacterized protein n=1 Tax=Loa loa TaxID=7209 RepID=A0A1I7VS63_LOALO